jgi:hypothetical protein
VRTPALPNCTPGHTAPAPATAALTGEMPPGAMESAEV